MAINVKNIIASALLELCETKSLEALTVKQILEKSGVSRQTFYNHFIDKNDLIQYVYKLGASELVPVFSYIFLGGKCKNCGEKISLFYEASMPYGRAKLFKGLYI